ncbi:hypothetical protein KQX54_007933 [Cotesia glomerata]|uniref:Uncharacterized protein n=1 Tax=Cotesia glomerata TaxID=32391 RepID=A0AAV7ITR7_COTGL|nr:hypothetical protein KQX54_007933 [Cotesia glomerata]
MTKPKKNLNSDNHPKESTSSVADLLERQENNNNDSNQVDDGNQELPEESPIEFSSSEFIKSLKPSSSTIEIVGRVVRIFPTRRHVNQETKEVSFVFKFVLSNDDQESVQVSVWNDEIDRVADKITNNAIVHIDGAFSKFIGKNLYYNYSTVEIELFIQSNTQVNVIRKVTSRPVSQEKQSLPLVEIENCDGVQRYIKTQLNIARIRGKDFARDSCVGSIANKNKYKLEIRIIDFTDNFISPFLKGEPVEVSGTLKILRGIAMIEVTSIEDISKIDDGSKMSIPELLLANMEISVEIVTNKRTTTGFGSGGKKNRSA